MHYGKTYIFFASNSLSCILFQAHDKEIVCHAFFIGCATKKKCTTSLFFAVRQEKTHDKDLVCRAFYFLAHDKHFSRTGR
jgi:hypothetical protein